MDVTFIQSSHSVQQLLKPAVQLLLTIRHVRLYEQHGRYNKPTKARKYSIEAETCD